MEWLPIKTAPRDGSIIDLFAADGTRWENCSFEDGRWFRYGNFYEEYEISPTHWMPLPTPPST